MFEITALLWGGDGMGTAIAGCADHCRLTWRLATRVPSIFLIK